MPPGGRVPSERAIAERFGLSRMTARQAVELLVRRGVVYRRPGSGTYVAAPRVEHTLQRLLGFTEQMQAQGVEAGQHGIEQFLVMSTFDRQVDGLADKRRNGSRS
jgi:GntR family transcriptional regulator